MGRLFLLFTIVPVVDLWLLLQIGGWIGLWPTVALVVATGMAGAYLARREGVRVVRLWQSALAQGRVPEEGVLSGALVLVGGALLVTPGVITDVVGLALLLPPTRRLVSALVRRWMERQLRRGRIQVVRFGGGGFREPIDVTPERPEERRVLRDDELH